CPGRKSPTLPDLLKPLPRELRDASRQLARLAIEAAIRRIRRLRRDTRELEGLAVLPGGVAASMRDRDRVRARRLIEIATRQRSIELRVVEHEAVDPVAGRR